MTLKEKVQRCQRICGAHVNLGDSAVSEILGALGYDFLWVDMEHTRLTEDDVHDHMLASRVGGTPVIVRVPADDLTITKRVLEMGPEGVVFPMVRNAEHAKQLLSNTLYPPYGTRGCGPKGAIRYGIDDEPEYYRSGHLEMCRFIQIELKSAAEDIEEIVKIPWLDGCILGLYDLSGSIGRPGDIFCPENLALAQRTIDVCTAAGKIVGVSTFATDDATLQRYHDMGIRMFSTGADYVYMLSGARETLTRVRGIQK